MEDVKECGVSSDYFVSPLSLPVELTLGHCKTAESLVSCSKAQFQPMINPS
jgi:hypothetical protein